VLNVTGQTTTLDDAFLDQMRRIGDPVADQVAHDLCSRGDHTLLGTLIRADELWGPDGKPSARLSEEVQAFLAGNTALPRWVDPALVSHAEEFFLDYGVSSSALLATASLPECYGMKYGTEVLCFTKFLQANPARRIRETAQMIMDVMCPGGLAPTPDAPPRGERTTRKVRLMHATIRQMILAAPETTRIPADPAIQDAFGAPINQEDLAFTLMTFSYVAVRGYQILGVPLTDRDRDAYVHCWCVVGWMMGIDERLLPKTFADSRELYEAICRRQQGASASGQELTAALVGLLRQLMPPGLKGLPVTLTREQVGDETAAKLGLARPSAWDRFVVWLVRRVWRVVMRINAVLSRNAGYRHESEKLHRMMLERMGKLPGNTPFQIPDQFVARWFPEDRAKILKGAEVRP
jgi:uncharacterized protein (DUF2236 family)